MKTDSLSQKFQKLVATQRKGRSSTNQWWLPKSAMLFEEVRESITDTNLILVNSDCVGVLFNVKEQSIVLVIECNPSASEGQVVRVDNSSHFDEIFQLVSEAVDSAATFYSRSNQGSVRGEINGLPPMSEIYRR